MGAIVDTETPYILSVLTGIDLQYLSKSLVIWSPDFESTVDTIKKSTKGQEVWFTYNLRKILYVKYMYQALLMTKYILKRPAGIICILNQKLFDTLSVPTSLNVSMYVLYICVSCSLIWSLSNYIVLICQLSFIFNKNYIVAIKIQQKTICHQ